MKFEIVGDKEKIKKALDEFIELTTQEYEEQIKKFKHLPLSLPIYDSDYYEDGDKIIYWNTLETPSLLKKFGFLNPFRGIAKSMEKNLEGFFKAKGIEAKVKLLS